MHAIARRMRSFSNFIHPKRRFRKAEQAFQGAFSKHFSTFRLEKCFEKARTSISLTRLVAQSRGLVGTLFNTARGARSLTRLVGSAL